MSGYRPESPTSPGDDPDTGVDALAALHAHAAGVDFAGQPGLRPLTVAQALRLVAAAPEAEVSVPARLSLLHRLVAPDSAADIPAEEYRGVAQTVAGARGLDTAQLLDDIKTSALTGVPLATTASGQALAHHEVAFIGENVCRTATVRVGGRSATWIYSEFTTDAPFDRVKEWINPTSWPQKGPLLFKGMTDLGSSSIPTPAGRGSEHWHGVFREEVQILRRLNTLLHCDMWADGGRAASMAYDLVLSIDDQIDVDRGYLAVEDLGARRRVRALKIVSFTADVWDGFATLVCPLWTDWVRKAVEGGSDSSPVTPDGPGPTKTTSPGDTPQTTLGRTLAAWVDFLADSARGYIDTASDSNARWSAGGYTQRDWIADGTAYWSQLAKDWARAWKYGIEAIDELAELGLDAGLVPPGADKTAARGGASAFAAAAERPAAATTAGAAGATGLASVDVPLPGGAPAGGLSCSDLDPVTDGVRAIPATRITVTARPGGTVARVVVADAGIGHGLYVGELRDAAGARVAAVQLYVARAAGAPGP